MKIKRIFSLLLSVVMIFSMVNVSVFADETEVITDSITVNVSIVQNGQFVSGKDDTKLAYIPVTVKDINNDGYDIDDALYAAHELYYDNGAAKGYASIGEGTSKFIKTLWGDSSGNFGYYVNNQSAWSLSDKVKDNDSVYAFIYQDTTTWSDAYTYFCDNDAQISGGAALKVKLKKLAYDQDYNTVDFDFSNATITIDEKTTPYKTDENGEVELYFAKQGTYTVSATSEEGYIAPPVCVVTVTSNDDNAETTVLSDKEALTLAETATADLALPVLGESKKTFISWNTSDESIISADGKVTRCDEDKFVTLIATLKYGDIEATKTFEVTVPSEKSIYIGKINDAAEKIASTYKNASSEWIVMDMGAYEIYAPETENKLTNEAKQKFINNAIATINNSKSSDTELDKAVLGLVAIGKNPEQLYPVNSNTPISAIEKLNGVKKSTSAWSAPFTLSAYNQGNYETDSYETEIINALLNNQKQDGSWDEWGTIDTTANVIAGLSFYKDNNQKVSKAIESAINYLSTQQNADGTYSDAYSGPNSNSTAMVVIGVCAAGVDLVNDTRFIKNENNLIDGLLSFLVEDKNGFGYTDNTSINSLSTEQGFRALIALAQTISTGAAYNVYDFSKNELTPARTVGNNSSSAPSEPSGDSITVKVTIKADTGYWLKNYAVTIPGENATVYHAFVKACSEKSITHQGAANGYVSSITKGSKTLAEFDKGKNSGWLYKVNGELPQVGLTECSISDGDEIVWYYTNDWTKDPSAGHYVGTGNKTEDKTEDENEITVSGNTANVVTSEKNITNAIAEAKKNNASEIVISSGDAKNVTNITLEIPVNSVKEIVDSKDLSLSVETSVGNVDISNEALNEIDKLNTDNKVLSVVIETKTADDITKAAETISNDELKNASIVDVRITSGDTSIHTFGENSLSVDVPVSESSHEKGKTYKVYIISDDGGVDITYGECVEKDKKLYVKVQTNHLSAFVVTDKEKSTFTDIADHWAADAIEYVNNRSVMQGVSETQFAPDDTMTRAMLVTVLYRLENPTDKANSHSFTDVKDGEWYAEAVAWAAENGIVNGVSETEFAPNVNITREQLAAVLYRYAQYKDKDTSVGGDTNILSYTDAMEISEYAIPAIQWIVGAGLMKGETQATVNPKNNSTRAQVATILMRYLEL